MLELYCLDTLEILWVHSFRHTRDTPSILLRHLRVYAVATLEILQTYSLNTPVYSPDTPELFQV